MYIFKRQGAKATISNRRDLQSVIEHKIRTKEVSVFVPMRVSVQEIACCRLTTMYHGDLFIAAGYHNDLLYKHLW